MEVDTHTLDAVISAFAKKLAGISSAEFDRFVACHDEQKKKERKRRQKTLALLQAESAPPLPALESPQLESPQPSPSQKKGTKRELIRQLTQDEASFVEELGEICEKTLVRGEQVSEHSSLNSKRRKVLEELAEMQKRAEQILGECHDIDCECEECEEESSE